MKKLPDEIRHKLSAPMPNEAIQQHPTKTFLSTIKAPYVFERLNDVFGIGGWTAEYEVFNDLPDYIVVWGCIDIEEPFHFSTPKQFGGHKKTGKNTEAADGYKSAVTDMISKCAGNFLEVGIDVFKGKIDSGGKQKGTMPQPPKPPPKSGMMSQENKETIFKCGKAAGLKNDSDIIEIVRWKASQYGIDPKSKKVLGHFIGKDDDGNWKFERVIDDYMASPEYAQKHTQTEEKP